MTAALILIALVTVGSAGVALALRNLIHSALLLVASWAGVAAFYLWAGAEFVAFAQVLVYVGAVSMIVLFAVLLTRRSRTELTLDSPSLVRAAAALLIGGALVGILFGAIIGTGIETPAGAAPHVTVRDLGTQLMTVHPAALLIVGAILTVALLGAVVIAATERKEGGDS
ncbi:MAG TPA: NADH-quinone oxidoreductase subunit J [Opitutaceae bacterium]|nr:NADH-quinone oxidoreductase subunit J [Opitutaceae bacterium]